MSDLVPYTESLPAIVMDDTALATLAMQTAFLPRLQLVTKGKYVDQQKIVAGHYGVPQQGGDEIRDLGPEIDLLILNVRMKALDISDKENIIANYEPDSVEFQRIKTASEVKDSGCLYGPTFLVFERGSGAFYEFFCGSVSLQIAAPSLVPFLPVSQEKAERLGTEAHGPLPVTLKARYVKKPKWGWHVPVITACSEPFTNLPPLSVLTMEVQKFANAKSTETVEVNQRAR